MSFFSPAYIISILIALSIHEWAHAYSAYKLGDPTAKYEGRLTINPLAHLDPIGTIMFILIGFGWGKPVPVNPQYFKHYERDTAIVAAAGPLSNLCIAIIVLCISNGLDYFSIFSSNTAVTNFIEEVLRTSTFINLALMAFNLLPIAPLDGSKIVGIFIPYTYREEYEQYLYYGPYVLLGLLVMERMMNFSFLNFWVLGIVTPIMNAFESVTVFLQAL